MRTLLVYALKHRQRRIEAVRHPGVDISRARRRRRRLWVRVRGRWGSILYFGDRRRRRSGGSAGRMRTRRRKPSRRRAPVGAAVVVRHRRPMGQSLAAWHSRTILWDPRRVKGEGIVL